MKAEELMIGDWMFCTYKQKNYKVAEIKTVADEELRIVVYDDNIPLVFPVKYFKPVPLTKDILEKNGWELRVSPEGEDMLVLNSGTVKLWWFVKDKKLVLTGGSHLKIGYVHQLQHALEICGIDQKIIL